MNLDGQEKQGYAPLFNVLNDNGIMPPILTSSTNSKRARDPEKVTE